MLQARRELYLAIEPLRIHAGGQLGMQHLDDDRTSEREVVSDEDARHSAPAKLVGNAIRAADGTGQLLSQIAHSHNIRVGALAVECFQGFNTPRTCLRE